MPVYKVPVAAIPVLAYATNKIQDGVPSRWDKIALYMKEFCSNHPALVNSSPLTVRMLQTTIYVHTSILYVFFVGMCFLSIYLNLYTVDACKCLRQQCVLCECYIFYLLQIGHAGKCISVDLFSKSQLRDVVNAILQSPTKDSVFELWSLNLEDGFLGQGQQRLVSSKLNMLTQYLLLVLAQIAYTCMHICNIKRRGNLLGNFSGCCRPVKRMVYLIFQIRV